MKINLAKPILDLDNNPVIDHNGNQLLINKELANGIIRMDDKENPLKLWELSRKIYVATGEIEIDTSDVELLKKKIKSGNQFSIGFVGQVLELLV